MRVARVLAAAAMVLALVSCAGSRPTAYGKETEATFVRSCATPKTGKALPEDVCRCAYNRITSSMTFAAYRKLDDQLEAAERKTGKPAKVPAAIADAFAACAGEATSSTTSTTR